MNRSLRHTLRLVLLAALLLAGTAVQAQRHPFEEALDALRNPSEVFRPGGDWLPYPAYADRKGWERLTASYKEELLRTAEEYLGYKWQFLPASTWLEYEKTGNRGLMKPQQENHQALIVLTLAELAEGRGRFIGQLADGLWFLSQQCTWSHAQHTQYQHSRRTLPEDGDRFITLHSANTASAVAIAWHFFREELDRLDPSISKAVQQAVRKNILDPLLDPDKDKDEHKIWSGFKKDPGKLLNNWTPYCNANSLLAVLLMEQDPQRLLDALRRCLQSVDFYMNDIRQDGACDEGPSYWSMSCGQVYDLCRMLSDASAGRLDLLGDPLIRRMGEFKSKTYFGDGWVMNYGDGTARDRGDIALMFRYGCDTRSRELSEFAVFLLASPSQKRFNTPSLPLTQAYRALETMRYDQKLRSAEQKALGSADGDYRKMQHFLRAGVRSEFYPQTEYAVLRNGNGWIAAAKGGNNGESHNHNDVGSFILMIDDLPILIDPGVGVYTKDTFSPNRYRIWYNRSEWHNAPTVNGQLQSAGAGFRAAETACDLSRRIFRTDIAGAYPAEAQCTQWLRSLQLEKNRMILTSEFRLAARTGADVEHLIVRGEVFLPGEKTPDGLEVRPGEAVLVSHSFSQRRVLTVKIAYPALLTPTVEYRQVTDDPKLRRIWGDRIARIRFTSPEDAPAAGSYTFEITKLTEVKIL